MASTQEAAAFQPEQYLALLEVSKSIASRRTRLMNRKIQIIPPDVMEALTRYQWPGNVRELQNFIERAVILSPGKELRAPLPELKTPIAEVYTQSGTLDDVQRDYILLVLRETKWVIGGPKGAAARLGLKRTSLVYRMQKLGISVQKVGTSSRPE